MSKGLRDRWRASRCDEERRLGRGVMLNSPGSNGFCIRWATSRDNSSGELALIHALSVYLVASKDNSTL